MNYCTTTELHFKHNGIPTADCRMPADPQSPVVVRATDSLFPRNGPRFKCCDHCGLNFPEAGQSICERTADNHLVECNEDGCTTGKENVANAPSEG